MQTIPLLEVKQKLSTQTERINFTRESDYYLPKLPGFDSKFFCLWLSGQKKVWYFYIIFFLLLALGSVGCLELPYFTKKSFTKIDIIQKFQNDQHLLSYIPDDIKINSLNRDFLLSVLMTGNQGKYFELYKQYKEILV